MVNMRKLHQKGIVSIVVTLVLILILTIVIISFSSFTRREQVETFERQLGTEAFYAAESGVNDALEQLRLTLENEGPNEGLFSTEKDRCDSMPASITDYGVIENEISPDGQAAYTCLLVDSTPKSLEITNLSEGDSEILPLQRERNGGGGAIPALGSVSLYWHSSEAIESDFTPGFAACQGVALMTLPETWPPGCHAGMLRVELVRIPTSGTFTEANLYDRAMTFYVKPRTSGGGSVAYDIANNGQIVNGICNTTPTSATRPKHCRLSIMGLPDTLYYARITSLYVPSEITICAPDCGVDTGPLASRTAEMAGSQAVVDSTGRASDILRRIQVRVDISNLNGPFPSFAVGSEDSICKRFSVSPQNLNDPTDTHLFGPSGCSLP